MKKIRNIAIWLSLILAVTSACQTGASGNSPESSAEEVSESAAAETVQDATAKEQVQETDAAEQTQETAAEETITEENETETVLAAGDILPDPGENVADYAFAWSGGTMGHDDILCDEVDIVGGQAYATIHFQRKASVHGKAAFCQVKSLDKTVDGDNTFRIPVNLNANTPIQAYSTAMSQGHWVEYTIYVGANDPEILTLVGQSDAGAIESTVSENVLTLDENAPQIMGLTYDEDVDTGDASYLKIFAYENGYTLIEVDTGTDTARGTMAFDELDALPEAESVSGGEAYLNPVIKYLVVPEGEDVPVGLDDALVILQQPIEHAYVTEDSIEGMLTNLELTGQIGSQGDYADWDMKEMLRGKTDLILESSQALLEDSDTMAEDWTLFRTLASHAEQLEVAMFIDRSAEEETEEGQEAWQTAYKVIFGD